jgi:subtilisin family serine protease
MNLVNKKKGFMPRILFTASFLSMSWLASAQMNPSVEVLVNQLQANNYPFELNASTGDAYVTGQIVLHFRAGADQSWKIAFKNDFESNLSGVLGIPITMRVVQQCNCETIETWELSTPSGALGCNGGGGRNRDRITTTGQETSSSAQGGDYLEAIDLNYYQTVGTGADIDRNHAPLSNLIRGIRANNANDKKIEIIDTGTDPTHPNPRFRNAIWMDPTESPNPNLDLNGNCAGGDVIGYNFVDDDNLPLDFHGHGTHVAGIAYKNSACIASKLLIAKALDDHGIGTDYAISCAIHYGVKQKVDVINMSFGRTGSPSSIVEKAVSTAIANNIVVVAAAGNFLLDNDAIAMWPANFPNVISVNATKATDLNLLWESEDRTMGSNYGDKMVHIAAEGEQVYSTVPGGYAYMSGTSMAAPQVAATAAVLKNRNPRWTVADIQNKIFSNGLLVEDYNAQRFNQYGVLSPNLYCNRPFPGEQREQHRMSKLEMDGLEINANLSVAPNPVTDVSMIAIDYNGNEKMAELMLADVDGKLYFQNKILIKGSTTQEPLEISHLPKGIYILKIVIGETILSKRIVKF